jgi:hypothetical protein
LNQAAADTAAHPIRLDEQAVELTRRPDALEQDREPDDDAIALGDADVPGLDLLDRQLDRVRMRLELLAIHRLMDRGTTLQRFQRPAFRGHGGPDGGRGVGHRT